MMGAGVKRKAATHGGDTYEHKDCTFLFISLPLYLTGSNGSFGPDC